MIIETATTIGTKILRYSVGQFCIGALERLAELPFAQFAKARFLNQFSAIITGFISVNCTCNNCIVCFFYPMEWVHPKSSIRR
jgi:hypothetical protein